MTGVEFPGDASSVCGRKIATEAEPVKVREAYPGNQSSKGAEARACIAFGKANLMAYGKSRSLCGLYAATAGSSLSQQDNANRRRGSGGKAPVGFGRIAGVAMRTVQTGLFPRGEKRRLALIAVWKRGGKGIAEIIRRAEGRAERKTASVQTTGGSPAYPSRRRGALTDTEAAYKDALIPEYSE